MLYTIQYLFIATCEDLQDKDGKWVEYAIMSTDCLHCYIWFQLEASCPQAFGLPSSSAVTYLGRKAWVPKLRTVVKNRMIGQKTGYGQRSKEIFLLYFRKEAATPHQKLNDLGLGPQSPK